MTTNSYFSPQRFLNYLKFDLKINAKTYLFFAIGLLVVLFFADYFSISQTNSTIGYTEKQYSPLFFVMFTICSILVMATSFPELRNKKEASHYFLLPASTFEKILVQFLIRIVAFTVVFFLIFWIDFKMTHIIYQAIEWNKPIAIKSFDLFTPFYDLTRTTDLIAVILAMFSVATFLLMGSSIFRKYALFKTILSFGILLGIFFLTMVFYSHVFYPEKVKNFFSIEIQSYKIRPYLYNVQLFVYILISFASLFFLPLTYFKLKEKQV
ncbi:hypothetical protein [Flavicella sediminum]|uniref:hypothetical protein n=1 Tax=Flavicella sediminum TaxID=2585141 RepID=UPI001121C602|nr:hypothetical protein [Flavicella sediminum]